MLAGEYVFIDIQGSHVIACITNVLEEGYEIAVTNHDLSTSTILITEAKDGSWSSMCKHADLPAYRRYIQVADESYLKQLWPDLQKLIDTGHSAELQLLYGMPSARILVLFNTILNNLPLIDGSHDWIRDVYHKSCSVKQSDWVSRGRTRSQSKSPSMLPVESSVLRSVAWRDPMPQWQKHCHNTIQSLLYVQRVVTCIYDIVALPFVDLYVMPSSLIAGARANMHAGMGLYCGRNIRKGSVVTQYDGVLVTTTEPDATTTHHMTVQHKIMCISGIRNAKHVLGRGGLSFANTRPRSKTNLTRFDAGRVSRLAMGTIQSRFVFAKARYNITEHSELFLPYALPIIPCTPASSTHHASSRCHAV